MTGSPTAIYSPMRQHPFTFHIPNQPPAPPLPSGSPHRTMSRNRFHQPSRRYSPWVSSLASRPWSAAASGFLRRPNGAVPKHRNRRPRQPTANHLRRRERPLSVQTAAHVCNRNTVFVRRVADNYGRNTCTKDYRIFIPRIDNKHRGLVIFEKVELFFPI